MAWDVLNGLKKFKQIAFVKLLGETVGTATNAQALLKDINGNVIMARTSAAVSTLQKKRGFAKGCILLVDASGPANQNTKGLYENVGTALLSRFNVVGQLTDPEFLLDDGKILIGDANGIARAKSLSGGVTITREGVATLNMSSVALTSGQMFVGNGSNLAQARAISGVIAMSNAGVASFNPLYADTHRVIAAGVTPGENDADATVTVTNALIDDQDVVVGNLVGATNDIYLKKITVGVGTAAFALSGNGGNDTKVSYVVLRPVNTNPPTTAPPTTAAPTTL